MDRDNSATANSNVSDWNRADVVFHAAGNVGYRGTNHVGKYGACSGCHEGKYDMINGSNHTYNGQGR